MAEVCWSWNSVFDFFRPSVEWCSFLFQVMTDVVGNPEEERRADFFHLPWSQEAVCRYFYGKVRNLHSLLRSLFTWNVSLSFKGFSYTGSFAYEFHLICLWLSLTNPTLVEISAKYSNCVIYSAVSENFNLISRQLICFTLGFKLS